MEELGKDARGAVGDRGWPNWWGPEEPDGIEAGEDAGGWRAGGGVEEDGEAEGEEVGGVADAGEDVARDLEVFAADLDDGFGVEELGDEVGYLRLSVKLSIWCGT